ncbi:ADP-ribosylation factor-like protein 6-interacting protein 1 [Onthophagus taurus]|uniref:ADP-ribosylation factor-like protein 6-interacting protein 1 n=1 Tax=Onthophagus taurus TaxID=166361 RepID=UPI000C206A0A|nr:ADP-ribosylation factor-like protein 6-interacting protein 1 [Onthophagus taurus]XP_022917645.1 ADP-ribosylation factor-like protein 6-interacting protein 1 [Onthophagus taurus]
MAEEEVQLNKLKESLKNWKEFVLPISSILLWDKQWYPGAIVGGTSILFMCIWLLDPSLLTTVSIFGLMITISDYVVPLLAASISKADLWCEKKDKQFEEICKIMLRYFNLMNERVNAFYDLRTTKPRMYYGCTILGLVLLAWIGNNINNLFLTYLLVCVILLIPGMERTGAINTYSKYLAVKISEMATNAKSLKTSHTKKD